MRADSTAQTRLPPCAFVSGEVETLFLVLSRALDLTRDAVSSDRPIRPERVNDN